MTANEANKAIIRALYTRHADAIADTEVNVPDLHGKGVSAQRMDFLAIACSWAQPRITCYEVKVDRRDFVQDVKWMAYLPACHELIFVTRKGIATKEEIPEEAGWQELQPGGGLVTRKKAPRHKMTTEAEATLYKHLLMRKSGRGHIPNRVFFEGWLKQKRADRVLGRMVGRELAATVADRLRNAAAETKKANARSEALEGIRETLKALGISDPDHFALMSYSRTGGRVLREKVEALTVSGIMQRVPRLAELLERNAQTMKAVADALLRAKAEADDDAPTSREAKLGMISAMMQDDPDLVAEVVRILPHDTVHQFVRSGE